MTPKAWCIKALLETATDYLTEKGIENARLNAEVLLAHQLHIRRISLYLNFDQPLSAEEVSGYRNLIRRRLKHEPLQYITGTQEFWSLSFEVNPHVLIPRPETEILVEQAVRLSKRINNNASLRILDMGTGSGIISVALAKEILHGSITATDISEKALDTALRNAQQHGVSERITFLEGDLFEPLMDERTPFDLIVSNPPYVCSHELPNLLPEVAVYEPRLALDGGRDGMDYLMRIIDKAPRFLLPGGWLLLEMSPHQVEKALSAIHKAGVYRTAPVIKDFSHLQRVVTAQLTD